MATGEQEARDGPTVRLNPRVTKQGPLPKKRGPLPRKSPPVQKKGGPLQKKYPPPRMKGATPPMSRHSSRGPAWEKTRARILTRDAHTCVYCGREATTVDHITPKAAGGTDEDHNLVAACLECNGTKQDRQHVRINYVNKNWIDRL